MQSTTVWLFTTLSAFSTSTPTEKREIACLHFQSVRATLGSGGQEEPIGNNTTIKSHFSFSSSCYYKAGNNRLYFCCTKMLNILQFSSPPELQDPVSSCRKNEANNTPNTSFIVIPKLFPGKWGQIINHTHTEKTKNKRKQKTPPAISDLPSQKRPSLGFNGKTCCHTVIYRDRQHSKLVNKLHDDSTRGKCCSALLRQASCDRLTNTRPIQPGSEGESSWGMLATNCWWVVVVFLKITFHLRPFR